MPLLAVLVLLQSAPGASSLAEDPAFTAAVDLYRDAELRAASQAFDALLPRYHDDERALILAWMGLSFGHLNELERAAEAFDEALALDRTLALPTRASPRVVSLFKDARARMKPVVVPPDPPDPPDDPEPDPPKDPPPPDEVPDGGAERQGPGVGFMVALTGVGLATAAGAGILGGLSAAHYGEVTSRQLPQTEAKVRLDLANAELGIATGLGIVSLVTLGSAIALLLSAPE